MKNSYISYVFVLVIGVFTSCVTPKPAVELATAADTTAPASPQRITKVQDKLMNDSMQSRPQKPLQALPPVIIYKTRVDYFQHVPVGLSADKSRIVSYPAISDIYINGGYALPIQLAGGFLLDQRGIDVNSAFLDFTYAAYGALTGTPTAEELKKYVLDEDPFIEMYVCRCLPDTLQLNDMIRRADFSVCKKLK